MSSDVRFDDTAARHLERIYRTPDVVRTRLAMLDALALRPGETVLDLGCGPGLMALDLARAVGTGGRLIGLDFSQSMLAMSRRRLTDQPCAMLAAADAARLPLATGMLDAAVIAQVYAYVEDLDAALAELGRVLRPGGRAVVLDTDFASLVWHSAEPERMARVLRAYDEHCPHPDLPRKLGPRLAAAGFVDLTCQAVPIVNFGSNQNGFSRGMTGHFQRFVVGRQGLTQADADGFAAEQRALADSGALFFSLNRYLFTARRP